MPRLGMREGAPAHPAPPIASRADEEATRVEGTARPELALEVRGLSKSFEATRALIDVDIDIKVGEIHGLVGPNGSGKSTLVKILGGFHRPDGAPYIAIGGAPLPVHFSLNDVRRRGVAFVHQDLALVPDFSVAENLAFSARGFVRSRTRRIRWRAHLRRCRELLEQVSLDVDPRTLVARLSPAECTLVAIARALGEFEHETLLVLDEPTARLPHSEAERLFVALRRIAAGGTSILYISHRLSEIAELTQRVSVFRDGRKVACVSTASVTRTEMAGLVLGGAVPAGDERATARNRPAPGPGRERVRLEGVRTERVRDVDLTLGAGEIVALTGPMESGASDIGRAVYGLARLVEGRVTIDGVPLDGTSVARARSRGVAYVPADRQGDGAFAELTLGENILVADYGGVSGPLGVRRRAYRETVASVVDALGIRPPRADRDFHTFSGGNQQKALLGRALSSRPSVLVLDEPTQGVDLASRHDIYRQVRQGLGDDLAVLWITSDVEEAAEIGNRVGVCFGGRLVRVFEAGEVTRDRVAHAVVTGGGDGHRAV